MRAIRAREGKVFGGLAVLAFLLMIVMMALEWGNGLSFRLLSVVLIALLAGWLAVIGFRAQAVSLDGEDILVGTHPSRMKRRAITEITSVRTIPFIYFLDVVWIRNTSGEKTMTVIRHHDLMWLMSLMPEAAITTYWRNKRHSARGSLL